MKRPSVLAALLTASLAVATCVAGQAMNDMPMGNAKGSSAMKGMSDPAKAGTHDGVGVVKNVDPKKGTITLDHEAMPSLNWSAMSMTFAADKAVLGHVKPGDKVHFSVKESPTKKGTYVVTSAKPQ